MIAPFGYGSPVEIPGLLVAPKPVPVSGKRPVRIPSPHNAQLAHFRAVPGDADCPATSTGAPRLCGQGPVSRASTLRSAVPQTLPDGSQHWDGYLRLIADAASNHNPARG